MPPHSGHVGLLGDFVLSDFLIGLGGPQPKFWIFSFLTKGARGDPLQHQPQTTVWFGILKQYLSYEFEILLSSLLDAMPSNVINLNLQIHRIENHKHN